MDARGEAVWPAAPAITGTGRRYGEFLLYEQFVRAESLTLTLVVDVSCHKGGMEVVMAGDFLDQYGTVIAAVAGVVGAEVTSRVIRRAVLNREVATLQTEWDKLRQQGNVEVCKKVNAVARGDPWAVLSAERCRSAQALSSLQHAARRVKDPKAWHAVLDGNEFGIIEEFLRRVRPLVWVWRTTQLHEEDDPPYNGDKTRACSDLYTAMRVDPNPRRNEPGGLWRLL